MFSYIFFFSLILVLVRSFVRCFSLPLTLSLLLSLLLFALCIHIRFNSSLFCFVLFSSFFNMSLSCRVRTVYTHTQNKWFENVFFSVSFALPSICLVYIDV